MTDQLPEADQRHGLTVAELIDALSHYPSDTVVEMAVVAPVSEGDDDITIDRSVIDGIMPWNNDEDSDEVVWLVGGNEEDVDTFLDALEIGDDE